VAGAVVKIIPSPRPSQPEQVQVAVDGADHRYRDLRIDNAFTDEHGDDVKLKKGAHVEVTVTCFADLPPSSSSKTRYLVRRLRSALPELRIAVGRWGLPPLADESPQTLLDAGANHVASLLVESRNYLGGLLEMPRVPVPDAADAVSLAAPLPANRRGSS
jgi:hypothetical protein